jgi:hypothetical protein
MGGVWVWVGMQDNALTAKRVWAGALVVVIVLLVWARHTLEQPRSAEQKHWTGKVQAALHGLYSRPPPVRRAPLVFSM